MALARRLGISAAAPETNAAILRGAAHFKADSTIEVVSRLPRRSWWGAVSMSVPRWLRDFIYDGVAQNRYRLFGRTETCMVPTREIAGRFLFDEADAAAAFAGRPSPFFQALLGADYLRLPDVVRRVHAQRRHADEPQRRGKFRAGLLCCASLPSRRATGWGPRYPGHRDVSR